MDNLSYSIHLQHQETSFVDDEALVATEGHTRRVASPSSFAFGANRLLDSLSPYAAVFGYPSNCPG